jgi:4-hydroxyphenylacetate 3-monooxygenase
MPGFLFQGCTRFAVKLDFIVGLLAKALHTSGQDDGRGVQVLLGEAVALRHLFWSLSNAMCANPDLWVGDAVLPELKAALAYRVFAPEAYPRILDIIRRTATSSLIYLPSSIRDCQNPELRPLLDQYVRGSHGVDAMERVKIMKLLWDCVGAEFGGRHELYEMNYAGGWEDTRLQTLTSAQRGPELKAMQALVDQCMADYDEHGWTGETWLNPDDARP